MVTPPWLCLTPGPRKVGIGAHPQDRESSALYISGSPWCRSRWHGPPQGHGAPSVSAPQSPSGNHRASSSWSMAPKGTTHSFHIALAGIEGRGREKRGEGVTSPPLAQNSPGELLPPALCLGLRPRGQKSPERNPRGWRWGKLSLDSAPAHILPGLPSWGPGPSAHSAHGALPGLLHSVVPLAAAEPSGQSG